MDLDKKFYLGTDLKFSFNINIQGFDMDRDGYELTLVNIDRKKGAQPRMIDVAPRQVVVENNVHYLCVNSRNLGPGLLKVIIKAHVPDTDFPDNERTEIDVQDLCILNTTY